MPNFRDSLITILEDVLEINEEYQAANGESNTPFLTKELEQRMEVALEYLEDQRDGYGSRSWDEDE